MPECHSGGDCPDWYKCNMFPDKTECPYIAEYKAQEGKMDQVTSVEITFPVPVDFPKGWAQELDSLVNKLCKKYKEEHPGRTMWPAHHGSKIVSMPMTKEDEEDGVPMEYEDGVYHIGCFEREDYSAAPTLCPLE